MSCELHIPSSRLPRWIAGCISPRAPRSADMSAVVDAARLEGRVSLMTALLDDLRSAQRQCTRPIRPG
jgi:hypothetical protein